MEAITGFKNNPLPSGKRSDDKAVVVLLGLTGAGKTTTLNFLFDRENMIKTDSYCSATSKIMEYTTKIAFDGDEYDLKVFDTPGFGDTRQQPQVRDARFVATFDNLLRNHEVLRSCYPTTVLLVAKFNDDRIDGETSHFIQMLKAVDSMLANWRLIDKTPENVNLIFVLTHTMSEDNERLRSDPRPKIQLLECLVRTFTKIPIPINVIMAENKPEAYNLPKINDFYKLPSGQYYPSNLFKKIQAMAVKANDVVGETIFREAFKNPQQINMQLTQEYELLPENNLVTKNVLKRLQSAKFNIESTQISAEIRKHWDKIDEASKKPYVNSLQITQSTFHRHGILGENDLPQSVEAVLKLLMDLPLNPPVLAILNGMGVNGPELPKALCIGNFYNIFGDCPTPNSPFSADTLEYTSIGFRAPRGIETQTVTDSLFLNSFCDTPTQYYQERLKQLNVDADFCRMDNFPASEPKCGYNIIPTKAALASNVRRLTGIREKRVFQVYLKNPTLSPSFRVAVGNLPPKFVATADADRWRSFFAANGTHIVDSIYAGGGIEVVASKKDNVQDETTPQNVLEIIANILKNIGCFCPMDLDSMAPGWDFKVNFRGGNPALLQPALQHLFMPQGVRFFVSWCDSLYAHPALLHSEIELECITHYLKKPNDAATREIQAAMKHLYGPQTESPAPPVEDFQKNVTIAKKPEPNLRPKLANHSRTPSTASSGSGTGSFGRPSKHSPRPVVKRMEAEAPKVNNVNVKGGETWGDWFKRKVKGNKNNQQPNYNANRNAKFY